MTIHKIIRTISGHYEERLFHGFHNGEVVFSTRGEPLNLDREEPFQIKEIPTGLNVDSYAIWCLSELCDSLSDSTRLMYEDFYDSRGDDETPSVRFYRM